MPALLATILFLKKGSSFSTESKAKALLVKFLVAQIAQHIQCWYVAPKPGGLGCGRTICASVEGNGGEAHIMQECKECRELEHARGVRLGIDQGLRGVLLQ